MKLDLNKNYDILTLDFEEKNLKLKDILSKYPKTILYFYPKDNTPGCSVENIDFTKYREEFEKMWIWVVWVSKDIISSHKNFVEKKNLKVDLISDFSLDLHKELWAYWEKNNYWKIVMWVIRSTFLIKNDWTVLKEWRNVRAKWHVERLLKELKNS